MGLLNVSDICKTENGKLILDNISFTQTASRRIAISGESGAGKTTLLKIIGGLIQPDNGKVLFNGSRVEGPLERLIPGHPKIAYMSQHFELRNHYRVEELLDMSNELPAERAQSIYRVCKVDQLLRRWTSQLSGGEKQRIVLARLLTSSPELLLLDEPFSNLDPIHKNILRSVIAGVGGELGITCLLTSHDPFDTLSWAEEIIIIKNGRIVQQDSPQNIYEHPADRYVAGMFGRYIESGEKLNALFSQTADRNRKYLRPENFVIMPGGPLQLTVTDSRYMGSHYEVDASAADLMITVRSAKPYSRGDLINVSLNR